MACEIIPEMIKKKPLFIVILTGTVQVPRKTFLKRVELMKTEFLPVGWHGALFAAFLNRDAFDAILNRRILPVYHQFPRLYISKSQIQEEASRCICQNRLRHNSESHTRYKQNEGHQRHNKNFPLALEDHDQYPMNRLPGYYISIPFCVIRISVIL